MCTILNGENSATYIATTGGKYNNNKVTVFPNVSVFLYVRILYVYYCVVYGSDSKR